MKLVKLVNENQPPAGTVERELHTRLVAVRGQLKLLVRAVKKAEFEDKDYDFVMEYSQLVKEANALVETISHTMDVHSKGWE